MSSVGAARASTPVSNARAEASRRTGAKSRGPKTPEGKARSAQNALKHGLRAQKYTVLPSESAAEFQALEAALIEELAPEGALQSVLAQRVVAAAWRLERAERLEAELFAENHLAGRSLGLALIRDCNGGARSFDTLLRYRGGTLAELWRALRTLKALQAERAAQDVPYATGDPAPALPPAPPTHANPAHETPIEPESRGNSGELEPAPAANEPSRHRGEPAHAAPDPMTSADASAPSRSRVDQPKRQDGCSVERQSSDGDADPPRPVPARSTRLGAREACCRLRR